MRSEQGGLSKAQRAWAAKHVPEKSTVIDAQRIDEETVRIAYREKDGIKYVLIRA